MFGKKFKVTKEFNPIYEKVGDNYPEYFWAYEEDGVLEYYIMDDMFGMPSPANSNDSTYSIKLRDRSSKILDRLMKEGYIKIV